MPPVVHGPNATAEHFSSTLGNADTAIQCIVTAPSAWITVGLVRSRRHRRPSRVGLGGQRSSHLGHDTPPEGDTSATPRPRHTSDPHLGHNTPLEWDTSATPRPQHTSATTYLGPRSRYTSDPHLGHDIPFEGDTSATPRSSTQPQRQSPGPECIELITHSRSDRVQSATSPTQRPRPERSELNARAGQCGVP